MKLIEAMKEIKALQEKADDLRKKVAQYSEDLSFETPTYPDTLKQVREWLQAHSDIVKQILRLRVAVQRTNLQTQVEIRLGEQLVSKTIAEWIHRRRDLAMLEHEAWNKLGRKGLKEGTVQQSDGSRVEVKIRRYFDPIQRDQMLELYHAEPGVIDRKLEVTNAITDVIE